MSERADIPTGYPFQPELEITPREASERLRRGDDRFLLIDCREQGEWETARVEGATLIPLGQIQSRIEEIESAGRPEVAVICHHGRRSMKAAMLLRQLGIEGAMSVAGGIDWWSRSVDASVPRYMVESGVCKPLP